MTRELTVHEALLNRGLTAGQLVVATAGHDTGRVYLVLDVAGTFITCTDGDLRPIDKPKRKRWRHVRPLGQLDNGWQENLDSLQDIGQKNALIRKLIAGHRGWN